MSSRPTICVLSAHPMALTEFQRQLSRSGFRLSFRQLDLTLVLDPSRLSVPRASIYLVDTVGPRLATESLIATILGRFPTARLLLVAEKFNERQAFAALRLGVRGLMTYAEAGKQLRQALPLLGAGRFWVPRSILSRFLDSILGEGRRRSLHSSASSRLSMREQQVFDDVLKGLSNKEIANNLHISERTVKFFVSSLLKKFDVQRRADLILLFYQRRMAVA